eukprot:scaffold160_cov139-Amphora_coffeaeformis.AAC.8
MSPDSYTSSYSNCRLRAVAIVARVRHEFHVTPGRRWKLVGEGEGYQNYCMMKCTNRMTFTSSQRVYNTKRNNGQTGLTVMTS